MRITFHGAARQVTGSAHLLEIGRHRILLDCGLFDSDRMSPDSPNRQFTFDPTSIDAVIVSHAHNDHIGRLPCLTKAGYRGPIYTTKATGDILNVMLRDSARIQREDARSYVPRPTPTLGSNGPKWSDASASSLDHGVKASSSLSIETETEALETNGDRKPAADDPPPLAESRSSIGLRNPYVSSSGHEPLFELHDVEWVVESLRRLDYQTPTEILNGVTLTYYDAGHILGSAIIQLDYREDGRDRRFVFTGDLGRQAMGLLPNPTVVKDINVLVSESTYGHKELDPYDRLIKQLHAVVARATRLQSKIIIPAFSLGRTQRMVYCFQELFDLHKVRPIPVYVDSPLASRLTDIHREHPDAYTATARRLMDRDPHYFGSENIHFCMSWDESKRLNHLSGPMVIIASSGMCEAGRIRHHLRHAVEDPDNAIVIVSYQAEGTLGRQIADGAERLQIMDQWFALNAAVYVLDGFSGHADRNDLSWWYQQTGGGIEKAFLVHGEPEAMTALAPVLQTHVSEPVVIPEIGQSFEV